MALIRKPIFSQEWVDGLKHIPELAMIATILIVDPKLSEGYIDPLTEQYVSAAVTKYEGKARIQPVRSAVPRTVPGDDTTTQTVLISYTIDEAAIAVDVTDKITVTDSPLNVDLLRYTYIVKELLDSSNPLERTLLCDVNQEKV